MKLIFYRLNSFKPWPIQIENHLVPSPKNWISQTYPYHNNGSHTLYVDLYCFAVIKLDLEVL